MDWAFASFLTELIVGISLAPMTYLLWASGQLDLLWQMARKNGWRFPPKEFKLKE